MMGNGSKINSKSASHKLFKDRAKSRIDDLQGVFVDLQFARKESRTSDVAILEEQVQQMLREWKNELNEPSPASSLQKGGSVGSFSSDIYRLLQICDEQDDATSALVAPKPEEINQNLQAGDYVVFSQENINQGEHAHSFPFVDQSKDSILGVGNMTAQNDTSGAPQQDYNQLFWSQDFENNLDFSFNGMVFSGNNAANHVPGLPESISPPPSAFLGPKCALWDCPRPAQGGMDLCQDYCSSFHHTLAMNEGPPGAAAVLRPGGIGLKDGMLLAALHAKAQGKDVGIPECPGAATAKSPWNAPEMFDIWVLEGETIREWVFFDKPRRAFESGNRKQRCLPDYNGRGWHESRKQVMNELEGLKRSYYMDPQPLNNFEWHLFEYKINSFELWALYRLELKKSGKGKTSNDSVADLQKQMGNLTAKSPSVKARPKSNQHHQG